MQQIRRYYESIQQLVQQNQISKVTPKMANDQYIKVTEQILIDQRDNQYSNLEQLVFYKQQYQQLRNHFAEVQKGSFKKSKQDPADNLKRIFQTSFQPKSKNSKLSSQINHKGLINDFFSKKQSELKNNQGRVTFKDVLENPVKGKNFRQSKLKPSIQKQDLQIRSKIQELRRQNEGLRQRLNSYQYKLGNQQYQRAQMQQTQRKIKQLEQRLHYIVLDNQQLREGINANENINKNNDQVFDDQIDGPYSIVTRKNNIKAIDDDNYSRSLLNYGSKHNQQANHRSYQIANQNHFRFAENSNRYEGNLVEREQYRGLNIHQNLQVANLNSGQISKRSKGYSIDSKVNESNFLRINESGKRQVQRESRDLLLNGNYFGSYIKSEDVYYASSTQDYGIDNQKTCSRNKVAFFKQSLTISRDQNYQISFKKSALSSQLNQQTVVFFVNNKTKDQIQINIDYKNYGGDYRIDVSEKLLKVKPFQQGKQVISITLCNYDKLESIIDAQFQIKDNFGNVKLYQLWVPACFIRFDYKYRDEDSLGIRSSRSGNFSRTKDISRTIYHKAKIQPDDQFRSYYHATEAGLPLSNKSENSASYQTSAWFYGESKHYVGGVKLTWNQPKRRLFIEGSEKWVDFIGFILHKYKGKP